MKNCCLCCAWVSVKLVDYLSQKSHNTRSSTPCCGCQISPFIHFNLYSKSTESLELTPYVLILTAGVHRTLWRQTRQPLLLPWRCHTIMKPFKDHTLPLLLAVTSALLSHVTRNTCSLVKRTHDHITNSFQQKLTIKQTLDMMMMKWFFFFFNLLFPHGSKKPEIQFESYYFPNNPRRRSRQGFNPSQLQCYQALPHVLLLLN